MIVADEPQGLGVVDSLRRPGRNVTGIGEGPEVYSKPLQLLKEAVPSISRVAIVVGVAKPGAWPSWCEAVDAGAQSLGLTLGWVGIETSAELDGALASALRTGADALVVAPGSAMVFTFADLRRIADFAVEHRLPSFGNPYDGMLIGPGAQSRDSFRRAAWFVKEILSGKKPAELPYEQPAKIDIIINGKTAKAISLTLPQSLLLQATEVIQ